MHCFKFILLYFFYFLFVERVYNLEEKLPSSQLQITRLNGECRGKNVSLKTYYLGVTCDSWAVHIDKVTLIARENLGDKLKLRITINKCSARENLDSCELFHTYDNLDYCRSINPDNLIASQSPFAINYQPKFKCPIKKATYTSYNYTLNIGPFRTFLNFQNLYWRVKGEIYQPRGNKLIGCINVEVSN